MAIRITEGCLTPQSIEHDLGIMSSSPTLDVGITIFILFYFLKDFIYLFMKDTQRDGEREKESEHEQGEGQREKQTPR